MEVRGTSKALARLKKPVQSRDRSKAAGMKVLIIDDHPLVFEAMRNVLTAMDRRTRIIAATHGEDGLVQAREHSDLDLVILDLMLPGVGGMAVLSDLRREFIALPVVVLSSTSERETVERAIRRGASGFITKATPKAAMIEAIRKVLAGEIVVPSETMLGRAATPAEAARPPSGAARRLSSLQRRNARKLGLTTRETEVLDRLLTGDSNKNIGEALGLAESTVKAHCSTIFRLMRVGSRSQVMSRIHEGVLDA
jgi:DNA-binding NarL/FixJ family response regulator